MAVRADGVVKSFAGVRVLDRVDIAISAGEVHALLGANGSGKSTLVKLLTGVYQPDAGQIVVGQRRLSAIASPHEASAYGIAVVHQEAPLIDTMTVAECVALFRGYPISRLGRVKWRRLHQQAAELLDRFEVHIDPRQLVGRLYPGERALVALVVALDRVGAGLQLLVLDEVTASLPEDQARSYLDKVRGIGRAGTPVLMVTHRLDELRELASDVTVLRDGQVVLQAKACDVDTETIVDRMIGPRRRVTERAASAEVGSVERVWNARIDGVAKRRTEPMAASGMDVILSVSHLSAQFLRDVSFELRRGELLGVAGLVESGVGELPQVLSGVTPRSGGTIRVLGCELPADASPGDAIHAGVVLLPADRLRSGGIGTLPLADNILLPDVGRYWHHATRERRVLQQIIADFDIRPPSARILFGKFSGGNQQKALLAKWLLLRPPALILDDPTSGVDPGAREKMFGILRDAAHEGIGILFFSTEPEQLAAMCSRVLVLKHGKVATELSGDGLTRESISRWSYA